MGMMSILSIVDQETASGEGNLGMEKLMGELPGGLRSPGGNGGFLLEKLEPPPFLHLQVTSWPGPGTGSLGDMWFFCVLVVLLVVIALAGIMFLYFRCGCSGGGASAKKTTERELCSGSIP